MVSLGNVHEISSHYQLMLSSKLTLLYTMHSSARASAGSETPFYDCRFNFVPTTGGEEGTWSTFTFNADTLGRACGLSASDCTAGCAGWGAGEQHSLNEYVAATSGTAVLSSAYAQAWALSMGDSQADDEGLQGCYGDIRFTLAGETEVLRFTKAWA